MEKTIPELEKELKDLQEKVKLFEMILEAKKKLEELGIRVDREKEYIPYPVPYYPPLGYPPYNPIWTTTSGTGSPLPNEDVIVS